MAPGRRLFLLRLPKEAAHCTGLLQETGGVCQKYSLFLVLLVVIISVFITITIITNITIITIATIITFFYHYYYYYYCYFYGSRVELDRGVFAYFGSLSSIITFLTKLFRTVPAHVSMVNFNRNMILILRTGKGEL